MARNTKKLGERKARAHQLGLDIATWNPDGHTRYRVFHMHECADYFNGNELYTAISLKELDAFLDGYAACYY